MRTKVRLVVELDNVDISTATARAGLKHLVTALAVDVENELDGGEIISNQFWRWFNPDYGDGIVGWDPPEEVENYM